MCGIAGVFAPNSDLAQADLQVVERLDIWQRHRGPDGDGLWSSSDRNVIFGHRRLAIIDTGSSGAQPMHDFSGRWAITLNGEIYNYRALRTELEALGRRFRTNSDTEVLINAVAEWGEAALSRLRGMFAFALWDDVEKELWLARDPYGIKPLFVSYDAGRVWFASQARALAKCAPVDTRRQAAALTGFYLWGHVPEPFSWWKGVQMFPPGCVQRLSPGRTAPAPRSFLSIPEMYASHPPRVMSIEEIRKTLLDSVRHHLVADTPVAIFLSAGIDSNVIAALAAEAGAKLRTVTLAFDEYKGTPNDEAPMAEAAAKFLGSDHVTVRFKKEDFEASLDHFFTHMDQPSIDGLNTYLVSRAASTQGLKVALSGLGGDEIFGGYPSFRQVPLLAAIGRAVPARRWLGDLAFPLLRGLLPRAYPKKIAGVLKYSATIENIYILRRTLYLAEELDELLDQSWLEEGLSSLASVKMLSQCIGPLLAKQGSAYAQVSALESCWYMRNQLLHDADWAGMAHGVEIRVPYVDRQVLENLAPAITSAKPPTKRDLASCATELPIGMLTRRKTGFITPVGRWTARHGERRRGLRGWADDVHKVFRTMPGTSLAAVGAQPDPG